ncbi:uncharacterized protein [Fopius arisanus]|uniref:Uncharacterized protein n=2 Tax=Fopius arisanus TaxID=64838 RepID=A0A9R1TI06_9HYME|nr:PREDICTED: uncharacterized protein LOC105270349 [Fopius arisanus]
MEWIVIKILLLGSLVSSQVSGGDDLLDSSQILWSKLLNGSLSETGPLDPLLVPLVKVDQSQGHVSYRMILSDVEITGLNESTIESVHIGRGSAKSHLSEYESGYVSYSEAGKLNAIRYRFHTAGKAPRIPDSEELKVKPIDESDADRRIDNNRFRGNEFRRANGDGSESSQQFSQIRIYADESRAPIQGRRNYQSHPVYYPSGTYQNQNQRQKNNQDYQTQRESVHDRNENPQFGNLRSSQQQKYYESQDNQRRDSQYQIRQPYQSSQRTTAEDHNTQRQHAEETRYYQRFSGTPDSQREYSETIRLQGQYSRPQSNQQSYDDQSFNQHAGVKTSRVQPARYSNQNQPKSDADNADCSESQFGCIYRRPGNSQRFNSDEFENRNRENFGAQSKYTETRGKFSTGGGNTARVRYAGSNGPIDARLPADNSHGRFGEADRNQQFSEKLENQSGYIDIIYIDNGNRNKNEKNRMRHFGNLRIDSTTDTTVYSFEDAVRDLESHRRFIIHNFTEGESLLKKNDRIRLAEETRRIEDLIRYAKSHQEKEGYFEEGMEIIYHYPSDDNSNSSAIESRRLKRAHEEKDDEDDIIHLVVKIRVPSMRVKAGYVLMGKVEEQVLRGDGRLDGNFTELIGDFTVELKKTGDNRMIVRTARAKLEAAHQNVNLEGMDEKGPVEEILKQGLVAAEAVAAMLADDLATKALTDKTSDSIIYKLYRELPE